jgi:glutamyl/glutaminyl-tRNA synthetase
MRLRPWFEAVGLWDPAFGSDRRAWFFTVLELLRPRARRLGDFVEQGKFFFTDVVQYDPVAVDKHLRAAGMEQHLGAVEEAFDGLETFDPGSIEAALRAVAAARGIPAATLIHAVRVGVTGKAASPGLFDVVALVGRERTRARLADARRLIASSAA